MAEMTPSWMPWNIDDYLSDTRHLSTLEHGAYVLLIMRYWQKGGLPDDDRMIMRIAGLTAEQWAESRDILASFFKDGWSHPRIDAELAKASELIGKRKKAAEQMHSKRTRDAHAVQVQEQAHSICSDTRVPQEQEQETANAVSAREPVDDPVVRTKKRITEAWRRLSNDPNHVAIDTGVVNVWAAQGLDMTICEAVVIAGLERDLPKGKAIRSLKWFEGAITEAHAKRSTVKIAPPSPPPRPRDPSTVTERKWAQMVTYFRDTGTWSEAVYGPAPGRSGCRAPPDILAQHGYGAAA